MEAPKQRSLLVNLGLALAATPLATFVGILVITLIGALDDGITKIQQKGYWWLLLIVGYVISLVYFLIEPKIQRKRELDKIVNGLILYWQEQLQKQHKPLLSKDAIKSLGDTLLKRVEVWAWCDPILWSKYFPDEQYSEYIFDIVDNLRSSHIAKQAGL